MPLGLDSSRKDPTVFSNEALSRILTEADRIIQEAEGLLEKAVATGEQELIEAARNHLQSSRQDKGAIEALTRTRFRETAIIYFGADNRSDYFEVMVDRNTGEMIWIVYSPQN